MQTQIEALATLIASYRSSDMPAPTPDHVERWITQFDESERVPVLEELHHVWSQLYLSEENTKKFLAAQIRNGSLVGSNPKEFWSNTTILNHQQRGHSQSELRKIFSSILKEDLGLEADHCGNGSTFLYLDDVLFTGGRVKTDLLQWIPTAPTEAEVHILLLGSHSLGFWQTENELNDVARRAGKNISFSFWGLFVLENRRAYKYSSDVLWPTKLCPGTEGYAQGRFPFDPRSPGHQSSIFSSETRRDILEQAMLKAGARIVGLSRDAHPILRPLGFSPFGVGFGSLFLSYRNCPNNAPLALWWGDPSKPSSHPLSKWYPLVPRRTYGDYF